MMNTITKSSSRCPLRPLERKRLKADLASIQDTARRKGLLLAPWEEQIEVAAAKLHFELGCWLYFYREKIRLSGHDGLKARIDCARRVFLEGIPNPGYRFFTVFDFGDRDFDTIFEMGDGEEVVDGLRKHLADDPEGNLRKAFNYHGWPLAKATI